MTQEGFRRQLARGTVAVHWPWVLRMLLSKDMSCHLSQWIQRL